MRQEISGAVLFALLVSAVPLEAQSPAAVRDWRTVRTLGIGYVGNLPRAMAGAQVYVIAPRAGGLGLYADFKMTHESFTDDERFLSDVTVRQAETEFGDEFVSEENHWRVLNVALQRPLTPEFALYVGAGYAQQTIYRDYFDVSATRGQLGHYRVEDDEESGARVNVFGGGVFRIGRRLSVNFGAELAPSGFNVGVAWLLPIG